MSSKKAIKRKAGAVARQRGPEEVRAALLATVYEPAPYSPEGKDEEATGQALVFAEGRMRSDGRARAAHDHRSMAVRLRPELRRRPSRARLRLEDAERAPRPLAEVEELALGPAARAARKDKTIKPLPTRSAPSARGLGPPCGPQAPS